MTIHVKPKIFLVGMWVRVSPYPLESANWTITFDHSQNKLISLRLTFKDGMFDFKGGC